MSSKFTLNGAPPWYKLGTPTGSGPRSYTKSIAALDIVFRSRRKTIFVHGCLWHSHNSANCPEYGRVVKTNQSYWGPKLS
jgi:DNA mismatch endonuclease Vsr